MTTSGNASSTPPSDIPIATKLGPPATLTYGHAIDPAERLALRRLYRSVLIGGSISGALLGACLGCASLSTPREAMWLLTLFVDSIAMAVAGGLLAFMTWIFMAVILRHRRLLVITRRRNRAAMLIGACNTIGVTSALVYLWQQIPSPESSQSFSGPVLLFVIITLGSLLSGLAVTWNLKTH